MAQVVIGGETLEVSLPNFKALKAAWIFIAAVQNSQDPMAGIEAILGVISVGVVGRTLSLDQLEERLTPTEMAGLRPFMNELMVEIGLAAPPGEGWPAEGTTNPSTAIGTSSSTS